INWFERDVESKGAAVCRNIGIDRAKGEYVIFLDSDDLLAEHCLLQRFRFMKENPNLDFAIFKMQFFKENPGDDNRMWNVLTEENTLQRFLNLDSVWQTTGPIWKTSTLKKIGGFDGSLQCWQDVEIHIKALIQNCNFKICYDLPLDCYYRKGSVNSISQSNTNSLPKLKSKIDLFNWVSERIDKDKYCLKPIVIHILISTINGLHYSLFFDFYRKVNHLISSNQKNRILLLATLRFFRLARLKYLDKIFETNKVVLISGSNIGKFYE
ncbi:glycosyltransferase, partial [Echinicola sediminis]